MRYLPTLCLVGLLILVGCTGAFNGLSEQEEPVTLIVNNSDNVSHTFEVWVVEGELNDEEVIIKKRDDEDDRASPGPGLSSYKFTEQYGYVTSIEMPPNRSRLHGQYTLRPGERNRSSIEDFAKGSTVVVVIYEGNRVVSLVAANCNGDLLFLDVTMRYYGSDSGYNCNGSLFWSSYQNTHP